MALSTDTFFEKLYVQLLCSLAPHARIQMAKEFKNVGENALQSLWNNFFWVERGTSGYTC